MSHEWKNHCTVQFCCCWHVMSPNIPNKLLLRLLCVQSRSLHPQRASSVPSTQWGDFAVTPQNDGMHVAPQMLQESITAAWCIDLRNSDADPDLGSRM
jgi:hypothetical protein